MTKHFLTLAAAGGPVLPSRVCSLLAQRSVNLVAIAARREASTGHWLVELELEDQSAQELEVLQRRLERLIDVYRVTEVVGMEAKVQGLIVGSRRIR